MVSWFPPKVFQHLLIFQRTKSHPPQHIPVHETDFSIRKLAFSCSSITNKPSLSLSLASFFPNRTLCKVEWFQNGSTSKTQTFLVLASQLRKRIMLMLSKMGYSSSGLCHLTKSHLCLGPVTFHNSFCSIIVHTESLLLVLLHQEQEVYTLWHKLLKMFDWLQKWLPGWQACGTSDGSESRLGINSTLTRNFCPNRTRFW